MALTLDEIAQRSALAQKALHEKDLTQAITILNDIIGENPDHAPTYMHLGSVLMQTQAQKDALAHLKKALELAPNDADNWTALGYYHRRRKEWALALQALHKSLGIREDNIKVLFEVMRIHRALNDDKSAIKVAKRLVELEPKNIVFLGSYAELLNAAGKPKEALKIFNVLLKKDQANIPIPVITQWYKLMVQFEQVKEARKWLHTQMQASPKNVSLKLLYASSCTTDLDYDDAMKTLEEAYSIEPENINVNHDLGVVYRFMGKMKNALEHFEKVVNKDPLYASALRVIGVEHKYKLGDDVYNRLNFAAAHLAELPVPKRVQLHYALGKAYDDVGDIATAFEHFKVGGKLHLKDKQLDDAVSKRLTVKIKENMTKEFFEQNTQQGNLSDKPVFILGMPRSGTSLIEQVLSSIDGVHGAGELKYVTSMLNQMKVGDFKLDFSEKKDQFSGKKDISYADRGSRYLEMIESLAPKDSKRIIDKMPGNYAWTGMINLILPNASIIHSRRHPIETCLSAYRIFFPDGQFWSFDLKQMGKYYREYVELMQVWENSLPEGTILNVRYEDMVSDLETQSKRLVNHIGMEWDESCMKFYESKRAVRTASVSQVRKPIYKTSVDRWHKYEPYLKPLLDEIGDIVKEYEQELII